MKQLLLLVCLVFAFTHALPAMAFEGGRPLTDGELAGVVGSGGDDSGYDYCDLAGGVRTGMAAAAFISGLIPGAQGAAGIFAGIGVGISVGMLLFC